MLTTTEVSHSVYCALCGVDIRGRFCSPCTTKVDGGYAHVTHEDQEWLSNVRALNGYTHRANGTLRVERSNVGIYDVEKYFGRNALITGRSVIPLYGSADNSFSTLPMHDACSEILFTVAVGPDLEAAFKWLQAHRDNHLRFSRRIEALYGGAEKNQGARWEEHPGEEFMVTDPLRPFADVTSRQPVATRAANIGRASSRADFFTRLPTELLLYILEQLITPSDPFMLNTHNDIHLLRHAVPSIFRLSPTLGNHIWKRIIQNETGDFLSDVDGILEETPKHADHFYGLWWTLRNSRSVRNRRRIARFVAAITGRGDVLVAGEQKGV